MSKIAKKLTDLIGDTPLLELGTYRDENNLEANLIAKVEYFNPLGLSLIHILFKIKNILN